MGFTGWNVVGLLVVAAVLLFIAAALVALGTIGGNAEALLAIGLACFAAAHLPWRAAA